MVMKGRGPRDKGTNYYVSLQKNYNFNFPIHDFLVEVVIHYIKIRLRTRIFIRLYVIIILLYYRSIMKHIGGELIMEKYAFTHKYTRTHTYTHTHTHTHTHAYIHINTHENSHMHNHLNREENLTHNLAETVSVREFIKFNRASLLWMCAIVV